MAKLYRVKLTEIERSELQEIIRKGKAAAYKRLYAQILLKADESQGGAGWKDERLAKHLVSKKEQPNESENGRWKKACKPPLSERNEPRTRNENSMESRKPN